MSLADTLNMEVRMTDKLQSRKLWVAVLGAALIALGDGLGLQPEVTEELVQLLTVYLLAQGAADTATNLRSRG